MPLGYALGHALAFGPDLDPAWPLSPLFGPALGAFAVLAIVALGAAVARAVCRVGARSAPHTAEDSRRDFLLRSGECAPAPPVRAPDTPGKPRPRAPGFPAAIG
ncbi:DUF6412 domain-containing protein [Streptomonospora litoralis]|uniref:Uncharacterized protein n=1 Tax=Streptomonospora litoralis TaxID=2498135 RepID=A0A4P6PYY5_9ACTN|nr:DUF6412 domain-containing protein [Streptomonospora litoralis]QBI52101.1 hypothetical protein EKD16_01420 [Streptomonospora litoralis]